MAYGLTVTIMYCKISHDIIKNLREQKRDSVRPFPLLASFL